MRWYLAKKGSLMYNENSELLGAAHQKGEMMSKVVLIDGHSILNRAFYGIPLLSNAEGLHTNAVYGFLNIMFKILDEEKPEYLVTAFDVHAPTFRHEMYSDYKGTRHPMPDELREQVPVIQELLGKMHIPVLTRAGYEADDILGTLSVIYSGKGETVSVISGDRDLLQLAQERVKIRIPKTRMTGTEVEDYFPADVAAKYGVTPSEFIDMKALMGDTSDNVPGVPGIGEKTASKIIAQYHSIENAHEHAAEIKPKKASENLSAFYDQALFSKKLVTIKTDCELEFDPEDGRIGDMFNEESYVMMKRLELKNILKRFEEIPLEKNEESISVRLLEDFTEASAFLDQKPEGERIGVYYAWEGDFECAVIAREDGSVTAIRAGGFLTPEYLREGVLEYVRSAGKAYFIDLKSQLKALDLDENDPAEDISLSAYLLNPLKSGYTYDGIAQDFLGKTIPSRTEQLKKMTLAQAEGEEKEKLLQYLAYEAMTALKAGPDLEKRLAEEGMADLNREIEQPLLFILHDMEKEGITVNRQELESYGQALSARISELEQLIYEMAGESFNINSPKQLGEILFEKLKLPHAKKTKTGYSTSAEVLEKLRQDDPIIGRILEYRQLTKLKSTYVDGLTGFIREEDKKIHCRFNQTITATGRISCADPNLQNIPVRMELGRLIRKAFVPGKGNIFINADYSQIELRVLAHMAGDENLIRAYSEARDIHALTASQVFHVPLEEVTPQMRHNAKAVNFGIVYGISAFGLSQDLSITQKEAKHYMQKYFETYPGVKEFMENAVVQAKEKQYSVTLYNRRRPIPELASKNFMQRSFGERVAMNAPIQGTAADIIKIAMIRTARELKKQGLKAKLILQIHDELLIEAPAAEEEQVRNLLRECMVHAAALAVPLEIDMHSADNWYDLK